MYVKRFNEERGHEFDREQGGTYGVIWREERKERSDAIII